ncbi:hypothetical protein PtB15_4B756 [Puccinia triticina]|nr:hypothetical protein PtB15_4B756 [Puccinia triticina]
MWLPYHSILLVLLSQLTIDIYATIGDSISLLRLPNKIEGNFSQDVNKFWSKRFLKPPLLSMHPEEAAISYFKKKMGKIDEYNVGNRREQRLNLVNQAVDHLLRQESISREHLREWCKVLTQTMANHCASHYIHVEILYAFHTLWLQKYEDKQLTQEIRQMMKDTVPKLEQPIYMSIWAQELHRPYEGLSINFRSWGEEKWFCEPRLKDLAAAMSQFERNYVIKNLARVFYEIFWLPPPKNISAQTRVASLALLFHLLLVDRDWRLDGLPFELGRLLINLSDQRFFLFKHELDLLNWILVDHEAREGSIVEK